MPAFSLAISKFAALAPGNATQVVHKVGIEILKRLVLRSPVDTGRFRANWQVGLQAVGYTTDLTDPGGAVAIADGTDEINRTPIGTPIWISNGLPYARRLEYGWSKQAPQGMVRLTILEFSRFIEEAVKGGAAAK